MRKEGISIKRKVIIDCDPGIDDSLALMLALSSEEIEVLGITIVCGNAPVQMGFENAKKVLKHLDRLDVPVYLGACDPLKKVYVNALDTHGADGLGESFLPAVEGYEQEESALAFLSRTLHEQNCSIIALGPLTNLAQLIEQDAAAFDRIERLVSMGGSYKAHGNCSPVAEYNYWEDSEAASVVYERMEQTGKKVEMIGLDVTRKIVLNADLLSYIERLDPKEGAFIRQITKFYFDFHWEYEHLIGCVINDPLAVAYFIEPDLCHGFASNVQIVCDGIARGQTVVDAYDFWHRQANAVILDQTDVHAFFAFFLSRILHRPKEDLDLLETLVAKR